MLDLQVTFMVRPAQKQCSLTMITQNGWIAFLNKQKESEKCINYSNENVLLHNFCPSGLASYLSTQVFKGPRELKFSQALSKVSKIYGLYDKY